MTAVFGIVRKGRCQLCLLGRARLLNSHFTELDTGLLIRDLTAAATKSFEKRTLLRQLVTHLCPRCPRSNIASFRGGQFNLILRASASGLSELACFKDLSLHYSLIK